MTQKKTEEALEGAVKAGKTRMSALGITGSVSGIVVVLILLAQMSGGLKLLGDWRADDRKQIRESYVHEQQHKRLDVVEEYLKTICLREHKAGNTDFDCTAL